MSDPEPIYDDPSFHDQGVYAWGGHHPDRPALISDATGESVTFGQLRRRANSIADQLRALGIGAGDTVASWQYNSVAQWEFFTGALQLGVLVVPISTHLTGAEAEYILRDSGAKALVAAAELAESIEATPTIPAEQRFVEGSGVDGWRPYTDLRDLGAADDPANRMAGSFMYYTSGTTGRPKGVRRSLLRISPEVLAAGAGFFLAKFGIEGDPGVAMLFSPGYHAAPGANTWNALNRGFTVVILEKFEAEHVLRAIPKYGVTLINAVPTHIHRMLALPERVRADLDLSGLGHILVAGAKFAPALKARAIEYFGPVVWESFAATEGFVCCVSPNEALERPGTVGRPDPDAIRIVGEDGADVGQGQSGTILFKSLGGTFDYHNDADKTAESVGADGFINCGDIGYLDEDGYLYIQDRRVDLIITGGVNVYPAEVEQTLAEHPAVADVAVVGVPDPEWGQNVVAAVQLNPGYAAGDALAEELRVFSKERIAGPKVPRRIVFESVLPRTATGKMRRGEVRDALVNASAASADPTS
ncbi:AMP-binding protein [Nocardia bovistercoris]|uniref:AMP-binding protein n=1 Tax=Nocardia bovistercoris TaxID=2785916 RepID=A0A931IE78_9NOCA|nr:AMP-binding protein [Nocardia bovistercoris]MBH0779804.1 AMP-binding protein [Nocardia bovistercoris]